MVSSDRRLAVSEPVEDLVAFPFGVGAELVEFAGGVLSGPRGLRACVLGARLGRGGAPLGGPGGFLVLVGLLACLVAASYPDFTSS